MILFADQEIPRSPISVPVASNHNARNVKVSGPGVEKEGKTIFAYVYVTYVKTLIRTHKFRNRHTDFQLCFHRFSGVESGKPTHFTIRTKGAGKAKPEVKFHPKNNQKIDAKPEIIDNGVSLTTLVGDTD